MKKLSGYEFTDINYVMNQLESWKAQKIVQQYDASTIAFKIEYDNPNWDIRNDADYKDARYWFIETTASCDPEEAMNWMEMYMACAISYGVETKNLDWMSKYMAAYDLFNEITR